MRRLLRLVAAIGLTGLAPVLAAQSVRHLLADRYELGAGADLTLHFAGESGGRSARAPWPASFDWFLVRVDGEQRNLSDVAPDAERPDSFTQRLPQAGVTLLAADAAPRVEPVSSRALATFLATRVGALRRPEVEPEAGAGGTLRVRRVESCKLLVRVLGAEGWLPNSATAQSKTGQRVEIRPLADPTSVREKSDLPLRVYLPGASKLGTKVIARHLESGREQSFLTDEHGTGFFTVSMAGPWTIEVHYAQPTPGDEEADWEIATATLTFEVPHFDPRTSEGGDR